MNEHDLAESLGTFFSYFGIIFLSVLFLVWIVTLVKSFVKERKFFAKNPLIKNNGRPQTLAGRIALLELETETLGKHIKRLESYSDGLAKLNMDAVQRGDELLAKQIDATRAEMRTLDIGVSNLSKTIDLHDAALIELVKQKPKTKNKQLPAWARKKRARK